MSKYVWKYFNLEASQWIARQVHTEQSILNLVNSNKILDSNHHFPTDLAPYESQFCAKSIGAG